ncbi:RIP metalloprotease RseP [Alloalcanivorax sp. C16-2]|uniref:RIP metalloprotease RseP n=1 Tax=Alloalcanivorax sp. C16-2 TaxID=3390052 RepID=UPI003970A44B
MLTLLAFVVTIVVIVAFHEWGHFLAMRAFGVRVLTFSVGFGPRLARFTDKKGTDWVISAIPLGGFVKPLDRRDDELPPDAREDEEFSGKPAWQRVVVYAAGPVFNFILAFLIYWLLMMAVGQRDSLAVVGAPAPQSAAAEAGFQAGDQWLAVDGREVEGWQDVISALVLHLGEEAPVPVRVREAGGGTTVRELNLGPWSADPEQSPFSALGLHQAVLIGRVAEDSGATRSDIRVGDQVLTTADEPVTGWTSWRDLLQASAGEALPATVLRDGRQVSLTLYPLPVEYQGRTVGQLGVAPGGLVEHTYNPVAAVGAAGDRFAQQVNVIWASVVKLFTGHLPLDSLGGPVTIAQVAGESAAVGFASFLMLLAYLSITLGVINLLPVPMLDGGWILFGIIEMIRGRSLPERLLMTAQGVGLTLVVSFMLLAIYNDLVRQFS